MCLGEYGTVVEVLDVGQAMVRLRSGARVVSLAVLAAEGTQVTSGDVVMVSMGMALRVVDVDDIDDVLDVLDRSIGQEAIG